MLQKICVGFSWLLLGLAPVMVANAGDVPTKDEVVAQVKKAVAFYKANGR